VSELIIERGSMKRWKRYMKKVLWRVRPPPVIQNQREMKPNGLKLEGM
jgi:hypothetical protein